MQDECFVLTVPDPTGKEPAGVFPHKDSPLVRDLMLLLEYDASPECVPNLLWPRTQRHPKPYISALLRDLTLLLHSEYDASPMRVLGPWLCLTDTSSSRICRDSCSPMQGA